jgi:hypothetical protein
MAQLLLLAILLTAMKKLRRCFWVGLEQTGLSGRLNAGLGLCGAACALVRLARLAVG